MTAAINAAKQPGNDVHKQWEPLVADSELQLRAYASNVYFNSYDQVKGASNEAAITNNVQFTRTMR